MSGQGGSHLRLYFSNVFIESDTKPLRTLLDLEQLSRERCIHLQQNAGFFLSLLHLYRVSAKKILHHSARQVHLASQTMNTYINEIQEARAGFRPRAT